MRRLFNNVAALLLLTSATYSPLAAQSLSDYSQITPIAYGDMESWRVREVDESRIIGGETKYLYEIASGDTIRDNTPYIYDPTRRSPWATSSVMAKVSGVTKASISVLPIEREGGYAAKCQVHLESCRVLGLINIQVVAAGSIFLGGINEPIGGTSNPQSKLITGIPFTERPDALILDVNYSNTTNMVKSSTIGKPSPISGTGNCECMVMLQRRWEDGQGQIHAERVATGYECFSGNSGGWQNEHIVPITYGKIPSSSQYSSQMDLINGSEQLYSRNSKGEVMPILEMGWAAPGTAPTHIIVRVSSSNSAVYTGALGSYIMVDNVKLGYK